MIGRAAEVSDLVQAVTQRPIVTLTGPGGTGKTRLAVGVARTVANQFDAGPWLVELAAVGNRAHVAPACAEALGLRARRGFTPTDIAQALGTQQRLIVLDNCEHVVAAAAELVSEIVSRCPGVSVLATSRERLDIADENVVGVRPMPLAADGSLSPAAELFLARAAAAGVVNDWSDVQLSMVEELCARVDGLPLAIELAAARCATIGIEQLLRRLDDRFRVLVRRHDADGRHRSLLATIDWSYALLSVDERRTFDALSVFKGDFDLAAAAAVVGEDVPAGAVEDCVASLVERSMAVRSSAGSSQRFMMLDSLRAFGAMRLEERGGSTAVQRRHLQHFTAFARETDDGVRGVDELRWHHAMLADWHNIRTAVQIACDLGDVDAAIALLMEIMWWTVTRLRSEVGEWVQRVKQLPEFAHSSNEAFITAAEAWFAGMRNDFAGGHGLIAEAFEQERQSGPLPEPWVTFVAAVLAHDAVSSTRATTAWARARSDLFWETVGVLQEGAHYKFMLDLGYAAPDDVESYLACIDDGVAIADRLGNPNGIAFAETSLATVSRQDRPQRAEELLRSAMHTSAELDLDYFVSQVRFHLIRLLREQGRIHEALEIVADTIRVHLRVGPASELPFEMVSAIECLFPLGHLDITAAVVSVLRSAEDEIGHEMFSLATFERTVVDAVGEERYAALAEDAARRGLLDVARDLLETLEAELARQRGVDAEHADA